MGLTLLGIGDSFMQGTGASTLTNSFIYQTSKQLKQNGIPNFLIDAGIGGLRSDQILSRYKFNGGRCDPDLAVIMVGTNDCEQGVNTTTFKTNLEKLIDDLRMNQKVGICQIVLCSIMWTNDAANANVPSFNTIIQQVATNKDCVFVDTHAAYSNATYLSDLVHPNDSGHLEITNILAPALVSLLS